MIFIKRDRKDQTGQKISPDEPWFANAKTATESVIADPDSHDFDGGIYAADIVRAALVELFHQKCAYCESPLPDPFDVEHFRPKGRIAENSGHLGYYWLAYSWPNLLPSCVPCNRNRKDKPIWGDLNMGITGGKFDQFPLADEDKRAMSPKDDITHEDPLILDPCNDNPEERINYLVGGDITGIDDHGETTVRICHLKRRRLCKARWKKIKSVINWLKLIQDLKKKGKNSKIPVIEILVKSEYLDDECEFAGAARFVAKHPDLFGM